MECKSPRWVWRTASYDLALNLLAVGTESLFPCLQRRSRATFAFDGSKFRTTPHRTGQSTKCTSVRTRTALISAADTEGAQLPGARKFMSQMYTLNKRTGVAIFSTGCWWKQKYKTSFVTSQLDPLLPRRALQKTLAADLLISDWEISLSSTLYVLFLIGASESQMFFYRKSLIRSDHSLQYFELFIDSLNGRTGLTLFE